MKTSIVIHRAVNFTHCRFFFYFFYFIFFILEGRGEIHRQSVHFGGHVRVSKIAKTTVGTTRPGQIRVSLARE